MNPFDFTIFHFLNSFAHRDYTFDLVITHLMCSGLTTGAVIMGLYWTAWEVEGRDSPEKREVLLSGLFVSIFSIFVARLFAVTLPFRVRPMDNPDTGARIPYGVIPERLINWSSFPSDHAVLFICLAAILWMVSRRLGTVALLHAILVVDLPRIYSGVHYPTDILAGTALGIAMASLVQIRRLRSALASPIVRWRETHPNLFHICFFLCIFEVAELFDTVRSVGSYAIRAMHLVAVASKLVH